MLVIGSSQSIPKRLLLAPPLRYHLFLVHTESHLHCISCLMWQVDIMWVKPMVVRVNMNFNAACQGISVQTAKIPQKLTLVRSSRPPLRQFHELMGGTTRQLAAQYNKPTEPQFCLKSPRASMYVWKRQIAETESSARKTIPTLPVLWSQGWCCMQNPEGQQWERSTLTLFLLRSRWYFQVGPLSNFEWQLFYYWHIATAPPGSTGFQLMAECFGSVSDVYMKAPTICQ